MRSCAFADVFTERDEQLIDFDPMPARKLFAELHPRLFRIRRVDVSPPVRHAVHVHVDGNRGLVAGDAENEARALRADSR